MLRWFKRKEIVLNETIVSELNEYLDFEDLIDELKILDFNYNFAPPPKPSNETFIAVGEFIKDNSVLGFIKQREMDLAMN